MAFTILSMSTNQLRAFCELVDPVTDFSQWEDEGDQFYRDMLITVAAAWLRQEQEVITRYFRHRHQKRAEVIHVKDRKKTR